MYELLAAAKIWIPVYHSEAAAHREEPERENNRISVLLGPFFCALECGFAGDEFVLAFLFALDFAAFFGVVEDVIAG